MGCLPAGEPALWTGDSGGNLSCEKSVSMVFSEIFICSRTLGNRIFVIDFPWSYKDALAWICRCTDVNILLFWCISYEYLEFERVLEQS